MYKSRIYIFLLFLLHFSGVAAAQSTKQDIADSTSMETKEYLVEMPDTTSFSIITSVDPVMVRSVPQEIVDSLKAADDFWYANLKPVKKERQRQTETAESPGIFRQKWFRTLLWIFILVSLVGVIFWYLVSSDILLFRKKAKRIDGQSVDDTTDDIFSIEFDKEISSAEEAGNYRLAVRLWYLYAIKALTDKNHINYQPGRTNYDYVAQLSSGEYYRDFSRLTRHFEYTWYGQFKLSAEAYHVMRNEFSPFIKGLR